MIIHHQVSIRHLTTLAPTLQTASAAQAWQRRSGKLTGPALRGRCKAQHCLVKPCEQGSSCCARFFAHCRRLTSAAASKIALTGPKRAGRVCCGVTSNHGASVWSHSLNLTGYHCFPGRKTCSCTSTVNTVSGLQQQVDSTATRKRA